VSEKAPPNVTEGLPLHGGDIQAASKRYGIAPDQWIDLSTGVAPNSYPIPAIPNDVYHRLPYPSKSLAKAVMHYYGQEGLAVAGSQAAIQALPYCLAKHPVLLPSIGYEEHKRHWSYAGNAIHFYSSLYPSDAKQAIDDYLAQPSPMHLVLINPNNPTALEFSVEQINEWAAQMHEDAYIIVDEAFADVNPELSMLNHSNGAEQNSAGQSRIIVMRSFGKFFGLAGIRLGFVFANAFVKRRLEERLGSWGVNGPAQIIAEQALLNTHWQQHQRANIAASSQQLSDLLLEMLENFQGSEARDKNAMNRVDM
jgi:cobalamin biosynthetic protein CobC